MADESRWSEQGRPRIDDAERARWNAWRDDDHGRYGRESGGYGRELGGTYPHYRTENSYQRDREAFGRDPERDEFLQRRYGWLGYGRDYGQPPYRGYGPARHDGNWSRERMADHERNWLERATDEVSSWFGDEEAQRRRSLDSTEMTRRGRGPKGYVRSDERIREDVCDQLSDDPLVDASEIEVAVAGSEVTLTGSVETRRERRRAEDCAERVSGVTHVQNNLRVTREGTGRTSMAPPSAPFI